MFFFDIIIEKELFGMKFLEINFYYFLNFNNIILVLYIIM